MAISKFDRFIKMLNTGLLALAIFMIEKVIVRLDTINTAINKQEVKNSGYEASLASHAGSIGKRQDYEATKDKQDVLRDKQITFLFAKFGIPLIQN